MIELSNDDIIVISCMLPVREYLHATVNNFPSEFECCLVVPVILLISLWLHTMKHSNPGWNLSDTVEGSKNTIKCTHCEVSVSNKVVQLMTL